MTNVTQKQLKTAHKVTFDYNATQITLTNFRGITTLSKNNDYLANVTSISRYGIKWFVFITDIKVTGYIKLTETTLLTIITKEAMLGEM